ncbi:hypothetical protein GTY54_34505 [Streptomyces sp. SID625]|nr:hypothetical protein [Streptomyces sp. SID625]
MWKVILYMNTATVAAFMMVCVIAPWGAAALENRTRELIPKLTRWLLVACLFLIFAATLTPTQSLNSGGPRFISWVPGQGLWDDGFHSMGAMEHEMALRLQLANSLMFVPFGILLTFVTRQPRLGRSVALCLTLSVMIEATQYAMNAGRTADIDDVMFNTLGGLLGSVLAFIPRYVLRSPRGDRQLKPLADHV